jgi:hypothetical protein
MPHIFTNVHYADMLYVYGVCSGSATAAVEEYRRRFPMRRIPDGRMFSKVCNTLRECGTLPSAHVSSERAREDNVEEQENILEMVQRSPTARIKGRQDELRRAALHVLTRVAKCIDVDGGIFENVL